jgi:glycosyltransferase involved in cell wall biosynthesis
MTNKGELVTVVIPTIRRPEVVLRACQSVLNQSYGHLEVIVVIAGQDEPTRTNLRTITDPRVKIVEVDHNIGPAEARNVGVSHATGNWVAFLDDDDEWLDNKIEHQVCEALRLGGERVFLACEFVDRGPNFDRVLPQRLPKANEPISEYLFARKGFLSKACSLQLQTSTYFASRKLCEEVLFRPEVLPHEDFDWLLRISRVVDRPFTVVAGPLSIYNNAQTVNRMGNAGNFEFFWDYAHNNRDLFTPDAYSCYIAIFCSSAAFPFRCHRWLQVLKGMWEGRLTPRCLLLALGIALLPMGFRRSIRERSSRLFRFLAQIEEPL